MAWIESHQTLAQHPKLLRLAGLLRISRPAAIGHLHLLWWWTLDYAEDGSLKRHDDATIARAAEWRRDPAVFVEALVEAGFIDSGRMIHDWDTYAGRLLRRRSANAARMRAARAAHVDDTSFTRVKPPDLTNQEQEHASAAVRLGEGLANGKRKPPPRGWTTDEAYLVGVLAARDERWTAVSPGGLNRIAGDYGHPAVEGALRLAVDNPVPIEKPYPWLQDQARRLAGEA